MLETIKLKKLATFDENGIEINNLEKINFIYGTNGSGKTSISNFLNNPKDDIYKDAGCSIEWKNDILLQTLVYNKNFRERNFGSGKIAGIFTLGEASTEHIKEIEGKQTLLKSIKEEGLKKKTTIDKLKQEKEKHENQFKEKSWLKLYKKYELDFKEAFRGALSKENFKTKLIEESIANKTELKSIEELKDKAKTILGEQPIVMNPIAKPTFTRIVEIECNPIWKKIIIGKADIDIAILVNKLKINDWVNQGRSYLQDDNICPFCQQETITAVFRKNLELFFDETYLIDLKQAKDLKEEYIRLIQNVQNELSEIESSQKEVKNTKLEFGKFSAYLKTLTSQCATNKEILNNKEKEPSRSFELISTQEQFSQVEELIDKANSEIKKHNNIVANFQTEKTTLVASIWRYLVDEFKTEIAEFNSKANGLSKGLDQLGNQRKELLEKYKNLDSEIKELSKNITSIQPTVDEINRLLQSFGFLNFAIVPAEEGYYKIQREDGTIAEQTLSEGEVTFITFLYFLQLAKGGHSEESVNNERIIVIDDPISSLDSNVLFIVSSLIKEIIKTIKKDKGNIKQMILLTHNVYFHKEVSFIDGRTKKCNSTKYWILRKTDKVSNIQYFDSNNPISSSYDLLWKEIKSNEVKSCTTIQNTMRRVIEYYFKFLGKYGDDELILKFTTKEEQEICRSLICWINDGSHSVSDDLFIEMQDQTIENYKDVFRNIFEKTDNIGHYNMMMSIKE